MALTGSIPDRDKYTRPDLNSCALLTIDLQNDFALPGAPLEAEGTMDIVPAAAKVADIFRKNSLPVVHVVRLYRPDGSNADICRRAMIEGGVRALAPGSQGSQIVEGVAPAQTGLDHKILLAGQIQALGRNEFAVFKPRWSAFFKTGLYNFLKNRNINTVAVIGTYFPNCVRSTIYDATALDLRVVVVPEAVAGIHDRGIAELKTIGCLVMRVEEIESEIAKARKNQTREGES